MVCRARFPAIDGGYRSPAASRSVLHGDCGKGFTGLSSGTDTFVRGYGEDRRPPLATRSCCSFSGRGSSCKLTSCFSSHGLPVRVEMHQVLRSRALRRPRRTGDSHGYSDLYDLLTTLILMIYGVRPHIRLSISRRP
ncbi:hypothetical protein VUR80DRAFT_2521 [Thermomyces stellatus]